MRITKAASALMVSVALVCAPIAAHAVPAPITIMPGEAIKMNFVVATGTCSAAAPARDNKGNRYLLTAGHCVYGKVGEIVGQPIYFNKQLIGRVAMAQFMMADYAVIKLLPHVRVGNNDVPHRAYLGPLKNGERVCFHGTKSGVRCGAVEKTNVTAIMHGSIVPGIVYVTTVRMNSIQGDSGSAVYSTRGVIGLLSGGGAGKTSIVPIANVYEAARVGIPGFHIA